MKEEIKAIKYWKLSSSELLTHYGQSVNGYDDKTYRELKTKYSPNELEPKEKESILEKILEQFEDPLVRILLGAALISFVIALTSDHGEGLAAYVEPFVILLILIANASIGIIQDINAGKAIDALNKLQASKCNVKRNGKVVELDAKDLIPGDIVLINEGEKVPADIRLIDVISSSFDVAEANFTGESTSAFKHSDPIQSEEKPQLRDLRNVVFSSTGITTGNAVGIVVGTGMNTELGVIQEMVDKSTEEKAKSPLEEKLDEFGSYLTKIIGAICIIVWVINFRNFYDESHGSFLNGMIYYFKISVALAVAAIPEGLPAVITTCFALGSIRMSANKAIVRKLDAIETLGCTSVICSDKTGTLTTNNMSVTKFMLAQKGSNFTCKTHDVTGTSFKPEGSVTNFDRNEFEDYNNLKLSAICASMCNTSSIFVDPEGIYKIKGSPTEGALRVWVEKLSQYDSTFTPIDVKDTMSYGKFISYEYQHIFTLEFDRDRKAMSVLVLDKKRNKPILFTKGAPEILINQCNKYLSSNGKTEEFDINSKNAALNRIKEDFMAKSLRTLALCVQDDLPSLKGLDLNDKNAIKAFFKDKERVKEIERNITLTGIVGLIDPPRPEVFNAICTCLDAGIRVIMITGDNQNTAEAIGVECGIVDNVDELRLSSFTTQDFFRKSENEQREILKKTNNMIFSRSEPRHKMQLVKLLKQVGFIVAMTGDGVNDAPALAEAHIGVAMGITGTDVAKGASQLVLADDNFATIVKAIEEGRSIYMNMKAFIRYLISSNIGEVVSIFITSLFGLPDAFTSIQLLWVNLVTDGPPATALGFNPPEQNIMKKKPRSNEDPLLTRWVILRYFIIGTYVGIATIGVFVYWYMYFHHPDGHSLVSWTQLTNWVDCEKWTDFTVNNFSGIVLKHPCDYFTFGKRKAATLSLTVLVIIEMFNAMNAISDESSLLTMPPYRNKWLILAIFFSVTLHCVILYIPFFNDIFGIMPLDLSEWALVIVFSFPVILIDEMIKLYVRLTYKKTTKKKIE